MKRIVFMGFLLLTMLGFTAYGQTIRVTGTVTDANDGSTLPGVSILIKGTQSGTVTDINGRYELNTNPNATLVFSFIGMEDQEIVVGGRTVINVALETEVTSLGEVVVVGYGTARSVGTVVGSLTKVTAEKLESKPVANVWDAMQGQVAGMQVYTSSGEPSQLSSVRLHGVGSLGGSSTPLYVLDGIPIASGNVLSISPNDIESVTVLKDASATSIYGSRAANGVIYITTKKGVRDEKAVVTVNAQYGVSSLANEDYFNAMMNSNQLANFWVETGYRTQAQVDDLLATYPHDTQWHKFNYSESAPTFQTDFAVQGGGGRTTYYLSGGYFAQDGLAVRSKYERYSTRLNVQSNANDWLEVGANLGLSSDLRQTNPNSGSYLSLGLSSLLPPFYSPYDEDGNRYEGEIPGVGIMDPEYYERKIRSEGNNAQLNAMGYFQLNPINGLTIRTQGGIDLYDYRSTFFRMPSYIGSINNGAGEEYFSRNFNRSFTNTVEYKFSVSRKHDFIALVGQEYVDNDYENFSAASSGHTDDRLVLLPAGPNDWAVTHGMSEYAFLSYFGRLDYSLDKKYYLDFSVRQDASSRFGRNNQTAMFYAAGFMWDVKKESFMQELDLFSSLRFKASYGTSGNSEIGNYLHLATIGTSTNYGSGSSWIIGTPGNPSLTWEKQSKATVGLNFSLDNDRYRFNVEYYNRVTSSMLIDVPQPYTSGFAEITENVGSMRNSGFDFEMHLDVLKGRDYYISPYVNLNYNKNEITELFQGLSSWVIPNTSVAWVVGKPVSFYSPLFAGIDPEDGMPMWYVPGEDRSVTNKDETTKVFNDANLEQYSGINRYAPLAGGFGLTAGYKGFSLQVAFAFVEGKYLLNNDRYFTENPSVFAGYNQSETVLDYWKEPGDITTFPKYGVQFTQFDDRLIEDASFIRLKNLTLSYNVPREIAQRSGFLTGARVFVTGRNLLTFTKYLGPDPEVDSNLTYGVNPNTKQITVGLSVNI
jgi:TonB-linked SusC/RagA family outer membrane protein